MRATWVIVVLLLAACSDEVASPKITDRTTTTAFMSGFGGTSVPPNPDMNGFATPSVRREMASSPW